MKPETETVQNRYVSVKDMNHERGHLKGEVARSDLSARGEPFLWGFGGALVLGITMVFGFLLLIAWNGIVTFYPKPIHVVTSGDGRIIAGEPSRTEMYKPTEEEIQSMDEGSRKAILSENGMVRRTLYRIGNFEIDDGINLDDHVILRNHVLGMNVNDLFSHVDFDYLFEKRNDNRQTAVGGALTEVGAI